MTRSAQLFGSCMMRMGGARSGSASTFARAFNKRAGRVHADRAQGPGNSRALKSLYARAQDVAQMIHPICVIAYGFSLLVLDPQCPRKAANLIRFKLTLRHVDWARRNSTSMEAPAGHHGAPRAEP